MNKPFIWSFFWCIFTLLDGFLQQTLQKTVIKHHGMTVVHLTLLNSEEVLLFDPNINLQSQNYTVEPLDPGNRVYYDAWIHVYMLHNYHL